MADVIGVLVLAAEMMLLALIGFPFPDIPYWLWLLAYIVMAIAALYIWHNEKAPQKTATWLRLAAISVVLGALSFGCDVLLMHFERPNLPLIEAGKHAGSPFGFITTVAVCPGLTMIAAAGLVRALYQDVE
jgi:tryptophan-rich sensory protein